MTKEELKKEAEESFEQYKVTDEDYVVSPYSDDMGEKMLMYNNEYYAEETYLRFYTQGYLASAEPRERQIAELEEKISVLLSCKNCPENKGGLICQKEYENKCLAQKIQFIKELQEENAELKAQIEKMKQERSAEVKQRAINEIVSAIEENREEGR